MDTAPCPCPCPCTGMATCSAASADAVRSLPDRPPVPARDMMDSIDTFDKCLPDLDEVRES